MTQPSFRSPRWLVSHAFVGLLLASFVAAGFWQLERLGERREVNERILAQIDAPPVAIIDLAGLAPEDIEYRPVLLSGTFTGHELLVANRSYEGTPGFWAWSSFDADDGQSIIVNRGFVRRTSVYGDTAGDAWRAPGGQRTIVGLLRIGDLDGRLSASEEEISRPSAPVAGAILGVDSPLDSTLYVELDASEPQLLRDEPLLIPPPELGEGPHLSYAFQWFTFTIIGLIGYPLALRRIRRGDASRGDVPTEVQV